MSYLTIGPLYRKIESETAKRQSPRLTDEQKAGIRADYYDGMAWRDIARKRGCAAGTIWRFLKDLPKRAPQKGHTSSSAWPPSTITALEALWQQGLSAGQIAAEIPGGFSRNAVIGKLHRLGLTDSARSPRSKSQAASDNRIKMRLQRRTKAPIALVRAAKKAKPARVINLPNNLVVPIKGNPVPFLERKMHRECSALINHGVPVAALKCCGGPIPAGSLFQFCKRHLAVFTQPARRITNDESRRSRGGSTPVLHRAH